jgi:anti-anti-sigma factor
VKIEVWKDRGVAFIEPCGDVNQQDVPAFKEALLRARDIGAKPVRVLVLDSVQVLDAEALVLIYWEQRRCLNQGGCLALIGVADGLRRVLDLIGLADKLVVLAGLDEALIAFGDAATMKPHLGQSSEVVAFTPGQRILLGYCADPNPLPPGATGTVRHWDPAARQLAVDWDPPHDRRRLMLAMDQDTVTII